MEDNKSAKKESTENLICFCKVRLNNGFVTFTGRIINISDSSIRLQISYRPSILDVICIRPLAKVKNIPAKEIPVTVQRYRDLGEDRIEVICESNLTNRSMVKLLSSAI